MNIFDPSSILSISKRQIVLYPFNYPGNKLHLLGHLPRVIEGDFFELFLGSGAVSYNMRCTGTKYGIELDSNVCSIHKALKRFDFSQYVKLRRFVSTRWDLSKKDDYYDYRSWFNKTLYEPQHKMVGLGLMFLANSCINGIVRFGPNGFNQASGLRKHLPLQSEYDRLHAAARQITFINKSYIDVDFNSGTVFADPPYLANKIGTYDSYWTADSLKFLLRQLSKLKFFYTDTENRYNLSWAEHHKYKTTHLKEMRNNGPGGESSQVLTGRKEILVSNVL